jgi:hypothetical protein
MNTTKIEFNINKNKSVSNKKEKDSELEDGRCLNTLRNK